MKESLKIISVLTIVCVICAFFLSFVYKNAQTEIKNNQKKRIEDAIDALAPQAQTIQKIDIENQEVYELTDKKDNLIAYAFLAQGQGYQGKIKILAIINSGLDKLEGIEIVGSIETPGLGAKIQEADFKDQFKNLMVTVPIECIKDTPSKKNQITAITGATVSSRAVTNILNKQIKNFKQALKDR